MQHRIPMCRLSSPHNYQTNCQEYYPLSMFFLLAICHITGKTTAVHNALQQKRTVHNRCYHNPLELSG